MHVFETPGSVSLQVKLPSGRVVVTTADQPRTTVEVVALGRRGHDAIDQIAVSMEERQGRSVVRIEQRDKFRWGPIQISWGGDYECRIACPPGTDLDLAGGSTDLRSDAELGDVSVRTASGDVRLGSNGGDLQVKTASGDVAVGAITGEASLVTVSGDLAVERVEASTTARSVSGDVTIGAVAGEVGLSTTSGDVDLKSVLNGEVRVQTVSGDVRIGVARGTRVWIDAVSVSGELGSELGLEDQRTAAEADSVDSSDSSVVPLHVKTVSGDVAIVRAAEVVST